jgi:hypothetical protein
MRLHGIVLNWLVASCTHCAAYNVIVKYKLWRIWIKVVVAYCKLLEIPQEISEVRIESETSRIRADVVNTEPLSERQQDRLYHSFEMFSREETFIVYT